ncbi:hypothetical protein GIB67_038374 [Kingdonia uniflora]|uniref:Uncharacterized protein n=1 Tax=Kingdonia uniflora TaxID=39325 RepID=A0A7J7NNT0_9MAGN|nr:hypothetical protein GIB67_038374 [Kingdonia uniflora]
MRYITKEAIMYCMEYMPDGRKGSHKRGRSPFMDDGDKCSSEYSLDKKGTNHFLDPVKYEQVRRWVLESYDDIDKWKEASLHIRRKHKIYTEGCTSRENETLDNEKVPVLKRLPDGPDHNAISYKAYRANDFVFHTKGSKSSTTTQNSGVTMKAIATFISRKSYPNGVEDETTYYGVVKEIRELDYFDFQQTRKKNPKVPVFRIDVYLATHTRADRSSLTPELDAELNVDEENQIFETKKSNSNKLPSRTPSSSISAKESPSSLHPSSPITLSDKEYYWELQSFTGKIIASEKAKGDSHFVMYNVIIDDVTYNPNINSADSDPSLSSLNGVELGTTIVWTKMLTRFFN